MIKALRYFPYLSLVCKTATTIVILLLSGWVVYTIKTTRHLHKPHNIFVPHLLVAGMINACVLSGAPIIMISFSWE